MSLQLNLIEQDEVAEGINPNDPFWGLIPFIDHPGVYNRPRRYEWERDWRVVGPVSFKPEDVAFLFIPDEFHAAARQFFANVKIEYSGLAVRVRVHRPGLVDRADRGRTCARLAAADPQPNVVPGCADPADW